MQDGSKKTEELTQILAKAKTEKQLGEVLDGHLPESYPGLQAFLLWAQQNSGLGKSEIVQRSGLSRTYAYQILQGIRQPSKDKLLCLCIAMGMGLDDTQKALRYAKLDMLYAKNKRDAIIIFALSNKIDVMQTNDLLYEFGQQVLE